MAYLTKAVLKSDWLKLDSGDTSLDTFLDRIIAAAEKELVSIVNQPIEQETVTLTWIASVADGARKPLWYTVPVSTTSLKVRANPIETYTTIASTLYAVTLMSSGYHLYYDNGFMPGYEYQLIASVGWVAASVPADIQTAGYMLCTEIFNDSPYAPEKSRFGVSAITEAQGGASFSTAIMRMRPTLEQKLAHHRVITI